MESPIVFISYTHENDEHKQWVRHLAEKLMADGITVILDQMVLRGGSDIAKFIEEGIRRAHRVLLVFTPIYRKKANKRKGGVGWESIIITGELFQKEDSTKFFGLLRQGTWKASVPSFLQTRFHYDFRDGLRFDLQYDILLNDLYNHPSDGSGSIVTTGQPDNFKEQNVRQQKSPDKFNRQDHRVITYDKNDDGDVSKQTIYSPSWYNKGIALGELGRFDEALSAFEKVINIHPDNPDPWHAKGLTLRNLGRLEEALVAYDKALQLDEAYFNVWFAKGDVLDELERSQEALVAYDKGLTLNPTAANIWYNKGLVLGKLSKYEEALFAHSKAAEISPDDAQNWNKVGECLYNLGRHEESLVAYEHAVDLDSAVSNAWFNKGRALSLLYQFEKAIEAYEKALEINPKHVVAWNNKGIALAQLGKHEEALLAYDKAIEVDQ